MNKFQRCILVCFVELLVLFVCLMGVLVASGGGAEAIAILALCTFGASLTLVIIFASLRPKDKDAEGR